MSKDNLIKELEELREQIRAEAERKMSAITEAIEAVQPGNITPLPPVAAVGPTPSVYDMMREAAEAMAEGQEDALFAFVQIKEWCIAKWPGETKTIRQGIYRAAARLVEDSVWDKVEHGFKIAQKGQP